MPGSWDAPSSVTVRPASTEMPRRLSKKALALPCGLAVDMAAAEGSCCRPALPAGGWLPSFPLSCVCGNDRVSPSIDPCHNWPFLCFCSAAAAQPSPRCRHHVPAPLGPLIDRIQAKPHAATKLCMAGRGRRPPPRRGGEGSVGAVAGRARFPLKQGGKRHPPSRRHRSHGWNKIAGRLSRSPCQQSRRRLAQVRASFGWPSC